MPILKPIPTPNGITAAHRIVKTELTGTTLRLEAAWGDVDGKQALIRATAESSSITDLASADALGVAVAEKLKAAGAKVSTAS